MSTICTKYRIFPTHSQQSFLSETLAICRGVYNSLLNTRKFEYEVNSKSLSLHDQINAITGYKKDFPELTTVHSQVLQNVAVRVDLAFQAFFRRVKRINLSPLINQGDLTVTQALCTSGRLLRHQ